MNKNHVLLHTVFAIFCAFIIQNRSFAEPQNLSLLKKEIQNYHDSGQYEKELAQVVRQADHVIAQEVAMNAHRQHPKKLAIVLDIDETSLSNYPSIVRDDFTEDEEKVHRDLMAARGVVIQPMKAFYEHVLSEGVSIFFVTGRYESIRAQTIKNLKAAGYHDWTALYLKPNDYHQASVIPYKSKARETITRKGYTIIASIGDQESDLKGGYALHTFKLPNPYYYLP